VLWFPDRRHDRRSLIDTERGGQLTQRVHLFSELRYLALTDRKDISAGDEAPWDRCLTDQADQRSAYHHPRYAALRNA
jgi:hypothetical protein